MIKVQRIIDINNLRITMIRSEFGDKIDLMIEDTEKGSCNTYEISREDVSELEDFFNI